MRVDQIFERGNKRQLRTQVADFNVQAAEAQLLDVLRQALFNLKQAFYTSVLARENLKVAQENLDYFTETEKLVNESFKAGAVAEVDLIRIRTQRVQYQRDYTDALKNYQQSARDLLNILGVEDIPLGALIVPTVAKQPPGAGATRQVVFEARGNLKIRPQLFRQSELRQDALENRPDVMNARKLLSANTSALMLARALRRRDVDVGFEYQRVGAEGTAGIVVQFPLFIFNNQKGAIDQAMAAMKASQMRLKQVELQALTDVDKAFSNYAVSEQLLRSYNDEFIKQAEEARNIEEYSYRAGQKSLIEFLDAQRAYNQARVALNQARFDYRTSLYQIEQATGKSMLDEDVITEFD
jgi:cobalt-zinc-cadmium efflux system outer membrane protein